MTDTPATLPNPEMSTIISDTVVERTKLDIDMTYLEKETFDKAICQKPRKKNVCKTDMHKIYKIIVGNKNEQIQDKAALDATLQAVKTGQDPIDYLMILKKLCYSNKSDQRPICPLCLATRRL